MRIMTWGCTLAALTLGGCELLPKPDDSGMPEDTGLETTETTTGTTTTGTTTTGTTTTGTTTTGTTTTGTTTTGTTTTGTGTTTTGTGTTTTGTGTTTTGTGTTTTGTGTTTTGTTTGTTTTGTTTTGTTTTGTTTTGTTTTGTTTTGTPESASVRVVHVAVDVPEVDVFANDATPALFTVDYMAATDYAEIPPGDYSLDISLSPGAPSTAVITVDAEVAASATLTAVAYGELGEVVQVAFLDDSDAGLAARDVRVNVLHGAYRAGTVDIWEVSDPLTPSPLLIDFEFGETAQLDLPGDTSYTLGLDVDFDSVPEFVYDTGVLPAGAVIDVVAVSEMAFPVLVATLPDGTVVEIAPAGDCVYADEPLPALAPDPSLPAMNPTYFSTTIAGVFGSGGWHDYSDGTDDYYGIVDIELLDAAFTTLCSITYDANLGMSMDPADYETNDPFGTGPGGALFAVNSFTLTGDLSNTNCGPLDTAVWASPDPRALFEGIEMVLGVGQLTSIRADLQTAVGTAGLDWDADWAPYVNGGYIGFGDPIVYETMYGFGYEADCGILEVDATGLLTDMPALTTGMEDGYHSLNSYYVFNL